MNTELANTMSLKKQCTFTIFDSWVKLTDIIRSMNLTTKQKQHLKGLAHSLKPVVTIGNKGLTPSVIEEIHHALRHHELIKIKIPAGEKSLKQSLIEEICESTQSMSIGLTGRMSIVFRQKEKSESKFTSI